VGIEPESRIQFDHLLAISTFRDMWHVQLAYCVVCPEGADSLEPDMRPPIAAFLQKLGKIGKEVFDVDVAKMVFTHT
jgi:hypothetical protein